MWIPILSGIFVLAAILFFGLAIQEAKKPIKFKMDPNTDYIWKND